MIQFFCSFNYNVYSKCLHIIKKKSYIKVELITRYENKVSYKSVQFALCKLIHSANICVLTVCQLLPLFYLIILLI